MSDGYEVVRYREEHRAGVLALQRHSWGPDPQVNEAYFAWKYEANPVLTRPTLSVALHRGEVVGMRGLVGSRWRAGVSGREVLIPCADDMLVAPEHRDRGLATRLIRDTLEAARELGAPLVLSLRASLMTLLGSLAAGYRSLGAMAPVGYYDSQARSLRFFREEVRKSRLFWRFADSPALLARAEKEPFLQLDETWERVAATAGLPYEVSREPKHEALAALHAASSDARIRQQRDPEFLRWVFRNPRLDYRFIYWGKDPLEGALVLHRIRYGPGDSTRLEIAEWEARNPEAFAGLLEAALDLGRFSALMTWTATLPERAGPLLKRLRFTPTDLAARERGRPAALVFATGGESPGAWMVEGSDASKLSGWKLRLLDQD